jgi:hypothetical protein
MRKLWTDGCNSFWHFTFGALTYKIPIILLIFLVYQLFANQGIYEKNVSIDLLEYFIGLTSMIAAVKTMDYLPSDVFTEIIPDLVMAVA